MTSTLCHTCVTSFELDVRLVTFCHTCLTVWRTTCTLCHTGHTSYILSHLCDKVELDVLPATFCHTCATRSNWTHDQLHVHSVTLVWQGQTGRTTYFILSHLCGKVKLHVLPPSFCHTCVAKSNWTYHLLHSVTLIWQGQTGVTGMSLECNAQDLSRSIIICMTEWHQTWSLQHIWHVYMTVHCSTAPTKLSLCFTDAISTT
jgi:hypothetical protein